MSQKHRPVSDADWNQLMTLAAGYLAIEGGDIQAAMSRAVAAHVELIKALKSEKITAIIGTNQVTMFVPDEGGVALRLDPSTNDNSPTSTKSTFFVDEDE